MDIPLEAIKGIDLYIKAIEDLNEHYGLICRNDKWYAHFPDISSNLKKQVANRINWNKLNSYLNWINKQAQDNFLNIKDDWERTFHSMHFYILGELHLLDKLNRKNNAL